MCFLKHSCSGQTAGTWIPDPRLPVRGPPGPQAAVKRLRGDGRRSIRVSPACSGDLKDLLLLLEAPRCRHTALCLSRSWFYSCAALGVGQRAAGPSLYWSDIILCTHIHNEHGRDVETSLCTSSLKIASDSSVQSAADLLVLLQDVTSGSDGVKKPAGYVTGRFNINSFYKSVASAQHVQTTKSHPVNKKRLVKEPGSIKRRNISAIWFQSRPLCSKIYLRCGRRFPIITSAE